MDGAPVLLTHTADFKHSVGQVPAYYTNRAFCHIKMENHGLAIADATVAIELEKTCIKAYYRRGSAYMALGRNRDALKDFRAVKQMKPNDKDADAKCSDTPQACVACMQHLTRCAWPPPHGSRPARRSRYDAVGQAPTSRRWQQSC